MKYILDRRSDTAVLFDLDRDPGETQDLLQERRSRSIATALAGALQARLSRGVVALDHFASRNGRDR